MAQGFAASVRAFAEKVDRRQEFVIRFIGLELVRRVATETPVDTGRARGNWQVSIGAPKPGVIDRADASPGASSVIAEASASLALGSLFDADIWISNNLPYIVRLEEGHSKQGERFVARAVGDFQAIASVAAEEAKRAIP